MNIIFDQLQGICPHNGSGDCDLQVENEAVTLMDGGEGCDNVECCEKQCPLNSDINKVEKQNDLTTGNNIPPAAPPSGEIKPNCTKCGGYLNCMWKIGSPDCLSNFYPV